MPPTDSPVGSPDPDTAGWTLATLHAHLSGKFEERDRRYEQRFIDIEKALAAALATTDKAIASAEVRLDQRFASVDQQFAKSEMLVQKQLDRVRQDVTDALRAAAAQADEEDPTVLTTQLVDRALGSYREIVETRFDGMDKAIRLVASELSLTREQTNTAVLHNREDRDREITALREILVASIGNVSDVTFEKFNAVDTRFLERDTRTQQAADESRISLDAALAAAKEAVSEQNKANTEAIRKSELATQKQIDSLVALWTTGNKSVEDKIDDLKTRIGRIEAYATGSRDQHSEQRLNIGQLILIISVLAAVAGVVIAVVLRA